MNHFCLMQGLIAKGGVGHTRFPTSEHREKIPNGVKVSWLIGIACEVLPVTEIW